MRKYLIASLPFILVSFFIVKIGHPQGDDDHFCRALDLSFNFEFDQAISLLDLIQKEDPDDLRPYFFKAVIYDQMVHNCNNEEENTRLFFENIEKAEEIAKKLESQEEDSWYVNFFLGGIYGWKGKYYLKNNEKWKIFVNGRKAKGYFERTIKLKPDCFDAYYGLGLYHYYAGTLPRLLRFFLPLFNFEGDVKRGIEELYLAKEKGKYGQSFAAYELACIYSRPGENHETALQLASELNEKYPQNFNLSYMCAVHYHRLKKDSSAFAVLEQMKSKLDRGHYQDLSPDKQSDYYHCSGVIKLSMSKYVEAQNDFESILGFSAPDGRKSEAYYCIGRSLNEQGKYEEAYQNYLKSLEHEDYFGLHKRAREEIKKLKRQKLVAEK
jgi:tetratricopeptide (TPR) repeat protein